MITVAGDARGVVRLVYVGAFVLAEGESCVDVAQGFPSTLLLDALQPPEFRDDLGIPGVDLYLRRDAYAAVIGADLPRPTTEVMAATQRPVSAAALAEKAAVRPWQSVPSWYLVATADQVIHPDAQRFMARRASAEIVEVNASHSVASSQPERVAALIRRALAAGTLTNRNRPD